MIPAATQDCPQPVAPPPGFVELRVSISIFTEFVFPGTLFNVTVTILTQQVFKV